jgi:DNA modification methylase
MGAGSGKQLTNRGTSAGGQMDKPKKAPPGYKSKDLIGAPWMLAFALRADGWYLRRDIVWHKANPMPESVKDRPTTAHEYVFMLSKSARYFYDEDAIAEPSIYPEDNRKARSNQDDYDRLSVKNRINGMNPKNAKNYPTRNARSVWTIPSEPCAEAHFAVMPSELAKRCILAGCPEDGTVIDPFLGAGTTALVADRLQRHCIGIELNPEYVAMTKRRIEKEAGLFAEFAA